jgi:hypothetical protein
LLKTAGGQRPGQCQRFCELRSAAERLRGRRVPGDFTFDRIAADEKRLLDRSIKTIDVCQKLDLQLGQFRPELRNELL